MLFGPCNAPAILQSFMKEVLEPFKPIIAGLLDNEAVWAETVEELKFSLILFFFKDLLIISFC